jgi:CHAT domain-containing protein
VSNFVHALIRLLLSALISASIYATPVWSQQQSDFDEQRNTAYDQFSHGHLQEAIKLLQNLVPNAPTKLAAANLERDLIEICSTGFFLKCYYETNKNLFAALQSDKELASLYPELMLYVLRERIWVDDKKFVQQVIDKGGPSIYAFPAQFPATYAQMQLAMHGVYVNRNDLKTAEEATSSAIMGLLLSDPNQPYAACKILVGLLNALLTEQDIVGAFQVLAVIDPYISKRLSHESMLYADYMQAVGLLLSFTNNISAAVTTLTSAAELYKKLDIAPEIRDYNVGGLNSLSVGGLAIEGKLDQAKEIHAQHPMQSHREEIIKRGLFQNLTEFYFAVADVFLSTAEKSPADYRWKALFEKKPIWDLSDYLLSVINSYRSFALGCLELSNENRSKAIPLFIDAAQKRLSIFESFQSVNFEGFQLPSFIDKLVIGLALKFAAESNSPEAANLMLRGSEVLLRNIRYSISDDAVLLAAQPDEKARNNAHSYINLVRQKRDWELKNIAQWLDAPNPNNKGAQIQEYTSVVTTLSKLKTQFLNGSNFVQSNGLPTVHEIQKALSAREVFITYFPMPVGFGRLCIDKTDTSYSFGMFDQASLNHERLLEFATTAAYGPDPRLDSQYPVESAIYLKNLLFSGLKKCMKSGSHVIVALPKELSGVPVAALLSDAPPRLGDGYDLRRAHWLIREFSFSFVVSARQYLAVTEHAPLEHAPLEYLGIGDPQLNNDKGARLSSALSQDKEKNEKTKFELNEIPETAIEVRAVANAFDTGKRDILLGRRATENQFRSKPLGDYDVIHFATHGVFNQDSKGLSESALILTPAESTDPFDDGILSASEIARLSLRARLVVLSACNSARYNQQQANLGVHDLQAAFTVAGAPTILAALWPVESATATDLMVHFFSNWRSAKYGGAAPSLAQTIRSYLDRSDQAHQHPRFWAPFEIFGNGSIEGRPDNNSGVKVNPMRPLATFEPFEEFKSDGEVIDSAHFGTDLILSLMGDWDGKRMAGIISDRDPKGLERWRVTSKEVSAGPVTVFDGQIFVLGSKGIDHFTPVIRSFDAFGRELWSKDYPDLTEYIFTDLVHTKSEILVVAHPTFIQAAPEKDAYLLKIDRSGNEIQKVAFKIDTSRISSTAAPARVQVVGDQVVVAISNGYSIKFNSNRKTILGLLAACFEGESVSLFYFGLDDLNLHTTQAINNFRLSDTAVWNGELLIGGELLDNCSPKGIATVLKVHSNGSVDTIWKDDEIFPSSVRGIAIKDGLLIAVNNERSIGIEVTKPMNRGYVKRWGDDNILVRDAALVGLSPDGKIRFKQDISAGLSVYLHGVTVVDGRPIVYGGLGGRPASTLH